MHEVPPLAQAFPLDTVQMGRARHTCPLNCGWYHEELLGADFEPFRVRLPEITERTIEALEASLRDSVGMPVGLEAIFRDHLDTAHPGVAVDYLLRRRGITPTEPRPRSSEEIAATRAPVSSSVYEGLQLQYDVPPLDFGAALAENLRELCQEADLDLTPWQMSVMESVVQAHQSGVAFTMSRPRRNGMGRVRAALDRLFAEGQSWIPDTTWNAAVAEPAEPADIVDEIDRLVADQLDQTPSGYDHNLNQDYCPHPWCSETWHGLAITTRMREMRDMHHSTIAYYEDTERVSPEVAAALEAYRYNEDDSEVICPGSGFTGEFTPPARRRLGTATISLDVHVREVAEELRVALLGWAVTPPYCRVGDVPDAFAQRYHLPAEVFDDQPERDETPEHRYTFGFDGSRQGMVAGMQIVDETMRFELEREGEP